MESQTPNQILLDSLGDLATEFQTNRLAIANQLYPGVNPEKMEDYIADRGKAFDSFFAIGMAFNEDQQQGFCNGAIIGNGASFVELFVQLFHQMPEFYSIFKDACDEFDQYLFQQNAEKN